MNENKTKGFFNWLKKRKRIIIGLATIAIIIVMIFLVDFQELIQKIITIGFGGLFLFILAYTLAFIFRAYKLKLIFKGISQEISYSTSFFSTGASFFINGVIPGKVGDFAKMFIIKDQENIKLSESVAGVAIERLLDLILLFGISCFALIFTYMSNYGETSTQLILGQNIQFYLAIGAIIIFGIFIALILLIYKTDFIINIISKISLKLADYLNRFITNFKMGIKKFKDHKKNFVFVVLLGFPTWIFDALIVVIFFYLLGYQLNILLLLLAIILTFFSQAFPITPGGWGISDNVGALFILFFYPELPFIDILAIFIIDHLFRHAYVLFFGGYSIFHFNFSLKEIENLRE